ncbi:ABC transporter permease [Ferruginibacter paludis]|jgi:phospholipid/cholesterol/gamma-HCH transport system permease protein|uniref:MlaE family ABC transporter permease n=1 Tax=Ferruginibacter TaxID=1004303 RepID=UPI0025B3B405|nr:MULTISPECIES: ABC transporter permease [Ferruginibacter]MDB5280620.1 transporter permease protein [Ferruginibacter sp.]MDN3655613.1 ABC transporter permease [Ferruginibacter paludis]
MEIATTKKEKYYLSKGIDGFFISASKTFRFVFNYFIELFRPPYEFGEIVKQCYKVGCDSLPLISLTGFIIGIVFTKQSRPSLSDFGATSWLPSLIGIAVFRALAPLVTALICAGKVGSSIGAELGAMKVTEQIEAMDVSASKPYKYLVFTRVTACVFMMPLLMLYTSFVALLGSYINVQTNEHTSLATFIANAFDKINFLDLKASVIKAVVFGFTIGMVACYKGFTTTRGTEGVGKAANAAVVTAMYLIFIEELMIVQIVGWFR